MLRHAILITTLALPGGAALGQTGCEPQDGDLFTRACLEARDALNRQSRLEAMEAICAQVGEKLQGAGRGSTEWRVDAQTARCDVLGPPVTGNIFSGIGGTGSGTVLSTVLGAGVVIGGGGPTLIDSPPGFEDYVEANDLVVVQQDAFIATMNGLELIGRAEEAGFPSDLLDIQRFQEAIAPMDPASVLPDMPGLAVDPGALDAGPTVGDGG